jgi:hypothetical protein
VPSKPIDKVRSGEQIVTSTGRWDRVHGVSDPVAGVVVVNSDDNSHGEYQSGTMVTIV